MNRGLGRLRVRFNPMSKVVAQNGGVPGMIHAWNESREVATVANVICVTHMARS